MFRGMGKDSSKVWSTVRFHVMLWVSVSKLFYNYSLGNILLNGISFFRGGAFVGFFFLFVCPCILLFILNESC